MVLFLHCVSIDPIMRLLLHCVPIDSNKELFLHCVPIGPIKELFLYAVFLLVQFVPTLYLYWSNLGIGPTLCSYWSNYHLDKLNVLFRLMIKVRCWLMPGVSCWCCLPATDQSTHLALSGNHLSVDTCLWHDAITIIISSMASNPINLSIFNFFHNNFSCDLLSYSSEFWNTDS